MKTRLDNAKRCLVSPPRWDNVVWCDEATFYLNGWDSSKKAWHSSADCTIGFDGEPFHGSVFAWCALSCEGKTDIHFLSGNETHSEYIEVLTRVLLPFGVGLHGQNVVFRLGREACYRDFISEHKVIVLQNDLYSPELNPALTIWNAVANVVYAEGVVYSCIDALTCSIGSAWKKFSDTAPFTDYSALLTRCVAVVQAKGGNTKY
jgi:hypothetical protein